MNTYRPTPYGEMLAKESGLVDLAANLFDTNYGTPLLAQLTSDSFFSRGYNDAEQVELDAIRDGSKYAPTAQDRADLYRGVQISEDDRWRYVRGEDTDTLFPIPRILDFSAATDTDRFIVSGVAGLQLVNFRNHYPLLAKSRFAEFGFDSYIDSCAFVGAYVVGRLIELDSSSRLLIREHPSFTYSMDGVDKKVSIGGTFHGDFVMSEESSVSSQIISPTSRYVEYGPIDKINVSGYHSVEPDIVSSMIVYTCQRFGRQIASDLVNDMCAIAERRVNSEGQIESSVGAFGDFGDGDVRFELGMIKAVVNGEGWRQRRGTLSSTPYAPQSNIMFEIVAKDNGIKFQNKDINSEQEVRGIEIDYSNFGNFFEALLSQTQGGLGRTSIYQLIELVYKAREIFAE